jgi:hypothetical protein
MFKESVVRTLSSLETFTVDQRMSAYAEIRKDGHKAFKKKWLVIYNHCLFIQQTPEVTKYLALVYFTVHHDRVSIFTIT